jgi:hypothetical protein
MAVAACSGSDGSDPAPSPSSSGPPPPSVRGRFIVQTMTEAPAPTPGGWPETVYEVWRFDVGTGGRPRATRLARVDHSNAAVSPDGRWLAYTTATSLVLHNLATGRQRSVPSKDTNECVRWAPDSRRLATALKGGVDLVGLDGRVTTVDRVRTTKYTDGTRTRTVKGEITCPQWLDADRLVYDRLTAFPRVLVYDQVARADTTTLAVVPPGRAPRLVDSAGRWSLVASCGGRLITTNRNWQETAPSRTPYLLDGLDEADLAGKNGALPPARALDTGPLNGRRWTAAFTPGDCRPVVSDEESVYAVDMSGWRVEPRPLARKVGRAVFLGGFAWSPQQHADTFATSGGRVHDLRTGGTTTLHVDGMPSPGWILAWLPAPP